MRQTWVRRGLHALPLSGELPLVLLGLFLALGLLAVGSAARGDEASGENVTVRGRVVWTAEALNRRFGANTVPEARHYGLALETPAGELYTLVEDVRGRAFRRDKRLREFRDVELYARKYPGSQIIQVIRAFTYRQEKRWEIDYWCEICAIAMYELKACDCCQGPIELRLRPAAPKPAPQTPAPQPPVTGAANSGAANLPGAPGASPAASGGRNGGGTGEQDGE